MRAELKARQRHLCAGTAKPTEAAADGVAMCAHAGSEMYESVRDVRSLKKACICLYMRNYLRSRDWLQNSCLLHSHLNFYCL